MSGSPNIGAQSGRPSARRAYAFVFQNLGLALRICGPWILAIAVGSRMVSVLPAIAAPVDFATQAVVRSLMQIVFLVVFGVALSAVGIAWHRFVLRGEALPTVALPTRQALPYLGWLTLFYIVAFLIPDIAQMATLSASADVDLITNYRLRLVIRLVAVLVVLVVLVRFALKLPAVALGDRDMTLRKSWRTTGSFWLGLAVGVIAAMAPQFIGQQLMSLVLTFRSNEVFSYLVVVLYYAVNFLSFLTAVTFLSLAYGRTAGNIAETFD